MAGGMSTRAGCRRIRPLHHQQSQRREPPPRCMEVWADRVEHATYEELFYAPSAMARAEAYARREAVAAHVRQCEAEEVKISRRAGKRVRTRELVASRREKALRRDY